jgi:hypothetical protein
VLSGLRSAAPLLALGLARLLATRAAGYQQHVGEYGVHWNFFLTAAAVGLLTLAVRVPRRLLLPVGLLVAAAHQAALSLGGLSDWVHSEERGPGWVSLNKEGVASVAGYWAIHLLGAAAGEHLRGSCAAASAGVRARLTVPHKRGGGAGAGGGGGGGGGSGHEGGVGAASQALWAWVARLLAIDLAVWAAAWAVEASVEPVSRRRVPAPARAHAQGRCLQGVADWTLGGREPHGTALLQHPPSSAPERGAGARAQPSGPEPGAGAASCSAPPPSCPPLCQGLQRGLCTLGVRPVRRQPGHVPHHRRRQHSPRGRAPPPHAPPAPRPQRPRRPGGTQQQRQQRRRRGGRVRVRRAAAA